jgi:hypothetical protein
MTLRRGICLTTLILALATFALPLGTGVAAEKSAVNPTGTWKVTYTQPATSQTAYKPILKLKLEGDKLTGTLSRRHNQETIQTVLEDAKLKGSEIFFVVSIPPVSGNGPNYMRKFQGKISGDLIKGKVEDEWMGQTHTLDWEAKRAKE